VLHIARLSTDPTHPEDRVESRLRRLARKIDLVQEHIGRAMSWVLLAMVIVTFGDVILRYAFNRSTVFTQELEWHLFAVCYLLAAGYTMLYDEHVRVDILYSSWRPRRKALSDFIFLFVFFFPSCLLVLYTTWPFLRDSFAVNEGSPDPGGIPARWALKSMIIIGFFLLILQGISQAVKNYYVARGWEEPEQRVKEIH
jgi:TRAP-type mannitol/chloroaromatic compound transport system permease small subunit